MSWLTIRRPEVGAALVTQGSVLVAQLDVQDLTSIDAAGGQTNERAAWVLA